MVAFCAGIVQNECERRKLVRQGRRVDVDSSRGGIMLRRYKIARAVSLTLTTAGIRGELVNCFTVGDRSGYISLNAATLLNMSYF